MGARETEDTETNGPSSYPIESIAIDFECIDGRDELRLDMVGRWVLLRGKRGTARLALQRQQEAVKVARARAEQLAIDKLNGEYGKNEKDRERFCMLAVQEDEHYQDAVIALYAIEDALAEVDSASDVIEFSLKALREERAEAELRLAILATGVLAEPVGEADSTQDSGSWEPRVEQLEESPYGNS